MAETDWSVEGDVIVQTVDDALVYVSMPSSVSDLKIYRLKD
jgi:ribosomal protein L14E/L6E/L27E